MKNSNVKRAALTAVAIVLSMFVFASLAGAQAQNAANAYPPGPTGQAPSAGPSQVVVTNTNAQPVPITGSVVTVPQGVPVQIKLTALFGFDSIAPKATYSIPAGKRLVIEHFATMCATNWAVATSQNFVLHLGTAQDTSLTWLPVSATTYTENGAQRTLGAAAMSVQAILDGGEVWVDGDRNTSGEGSVSCDVAILGYLLPIPQQPSN